MSREIDRPVPEQPEQMGQGNDSEYRARDLYVGSHDDPPLRALELGSAARMQHLEPPSNTGHILRETGAEFCEQGALLGLDLISSHVCNEDRQEQGRAGI